MSTEKSTIRLNGESYDCNTPLSVAALLDSLGMAGRPVVVELDEEAVFPRDYAIAMVRAGSRVEVVALAAGG